MTEITRAEHLAWCKARALEYVDAGDLDQAFASMLSDLSKHPGTNDSQAIGSILGMGLRINGHLNTPALMRDFIEGFN